MNVVNVDIGKVMKYRWLEHTQNQLIVSYEAIFRGMKMYLYLNNGFHYLIQSN